ncbi:ATP-binding cassette sub-family A member 3-like isoform X1, partial [Biomphalaria pfeifferi]
MLIVHLKAILWKNSIVLRRNVLSTLLQIGLPLMLIFMTFTSFHEKEENRASALDRLRMPVDVTDISECPLTYEPFSSPALAELFGIGYKKKDLEIVPNNYTLNKTDSWDQCIVDRIIFQIDEAAREIPKNLVFQVATSTEYSTEEIYGPHEYLHRVPLMQYVVTKNFIRYWKIRTSSEPRLYTSFHTMKMPSKRTASEKRLGAVEQLNKYFSILFFSIFVCSLGYIVEEKETKIKESMKLMGLSTFTFWLSWFITNFLVGMVIILAFTVLCSVGFYGAGKILYSNPVMTVAFMTLYLANVISFSFLLSCFVNRARDSTMYSATVFIAMNYGSPIVAQFLSDRFSSLVAGSLLFQFGNNYFREIFFKLEMRDVGLSFSKMFAYEDFPNVSLFDTSIMMALNMLLHFFLIWYMENVFPGEYGIPRPYYFFLTNSYWCPSIALGDNIPELPKTDEQLFEPTNPNLKAGIKIRGLVKVFNGKMAVGGVNLDIYEDQMTVLLGHNGAGKTTTINMITGFLKPSKGTVILNGYDVSQNLIQARERVGLCPQHDILFPRLTCKEHLIFYSKLRNQYRGISEENEAVDLLNAVGIKDKVFTHSRFLSGGQKRKLSCACAFIGSTKTIFLDEPSSGLDPSARRELWEFLQACKMGRIILLTTHYMDEADVLGDRIVIMAEGVVKCCGSSNFLKRIYGTGYQLSIEKRSGCSVSAVTSKIRKHIDDAELTKENNQEIFYILPEDKVPRFSKMLSDLERSQHDLNIANFGLTATTMEDVFVRVGQGFEPKNFTSRAKISSLIPDESRISPTSSKDLTRQRAHSPEQNRRNAPKNVSRNNSKEFEREKSSVEETPKTSISQHESDSKNTGNSQEKSHESPTIPAGSSDMIIETKNKGASDQLFDKMSSFKKLRPFTLFMQQIRAIFIKKFLLCRHAWLMSLVLIALPVALTSLGIKHDLSTKTIIPKDLNFTLDRFPTDLKFLHFYEHGSDDTISRQYKALYDKKFGTVLQFPLNKLAQFSQQVREALANVDAEEYTQKYLFGIAETRNTSGLIVLYQETAVHAKSIAVQLALNAWVQETLGSEYSVQSGVHYVPSWTASSLIKKLQIATTFCLGFSMALIPVMFIYPLTVERAIGAKHLQSLSGISPLAYWMGTFAFDMIMYLATISLMILAFLINPHVYIDDNRWMLTTFVLVVYGCAIFPYMYAVQFLFKSPTVASSTLLLLAIFVGIIISLIMSIIRAIVSMSNFVYFIHLVFVALSPSYSLNSIFFMYILISVASLSTTQNQTFTDYLKMQVGNLVLYSNLVDMAVVALLSVVALIIIEFRFDRFLWYSIMAVVPCSCKTTTFRKRTEDEDVVKERMVIKATPKSDLLRDNALVLQDLHKCYLTTHCTRRFIAVHSTSISVLHKECLGLLGQNGAGKTTTFKMITGDEMITSGCVFAEGLSVKTHLKDVQSIMGYCPQHDALHDLLTGVETLHLYGRIRGVPPSALKSVVQAVIDLITLSPHENKQTKNYSGGNKRKLSVGICIIGNPRLIMLDEPTAGMDPMARRKLWEVLHLIRASGKTLVLTSHSMEECEALCTRIAIMVQGVVLCLGSLQHLKSKYGQGYTVILHAARDTSDRVASLREAKNHVLKTLVNSTIFSEHDAYVDIHVPVDNPLSRIFDTLQNAKERYRFEHYTVQQTSLEQIFLRFMKMETDL